MARNLTEKQQKFLDCLFDDECKGSFKKAATKAGYTGVNRHWLTKDLREEIIEAAENYMAVHAIEATEGLINVLQQPHDPAQDKRLAAAKEILDRSGLGKVDRVKIGTGSTVGLFILPPKAEIKVHDDSSGGEQDQT